MHHALLARSLYFLALVAICVLASCQSSGEITPVTTSTHASICTPAGMIVPIVVNAGIPNVNVSFSGEPATITVNPATTLTDGSGDATAIALVPYGTSGEVVASAVGATTGGIPVPASAPSVVFALKSLSMDTETGQSAGEIGAVGQIYDVAIQVTQPQPCTTALAELPVTLSVVQPSAAAAGSSSGSSGSSSGSSASGSTSSGSAGASSGASSGSSTATGSSLPGAVTVFTDSTGTAEGKIVVPWGADALIQVSGGAQVQWFPIGNGLANPATITCISLTQGSSQQSNNIYTVTATVAYNSGPFPGVPVTFAIISPIAVTTTTGAPAIVMPATATTNQEGAAVAYVALESVNNAPTTPPVTVEAVAGSSAATATITSSASGSSPSPCPAVP